MKKRILSLIFLILLISPVFAAPFGRILHFLTLDGLIITIDAPLEVKAGEEFDVSLKIHPRLVEIAYPHTIYIEFFIIGFPSAEYKETILSQQYLSEDFSETFRLKENTSTSCEIHVSYVINKGTSSEREYHESFFLDLTYAPDKTRAELEYDYNVLSQNYTRLKYDYNSLQKKYEDLKTEYETLNVDYLLLSENHQKLIVMAIILVLTTIIFSASTIYLMLKRKQQGKQKSK